MVMGPERFTGL